MSQRTQTIYIILIGIPLLFLILPPTQPSMIVAIGLFCHLLLWVLDCLCASHILPVPAPISWLIIGGMIGASLGFWTVAPSAGKRHLRQIAVTVPLVIVGCVAIIDATYSILSRAPAPAAQRPASTPAAQPQLNQVPGAEPTAGTTATGS